MSSGGFLPPQNPPGPPLTPSSARIASLVPGSDVSSPASLVSALLEAIKEIPATTAKQKFHKLAPDTFNKISEIAHRLQPALQRHSHQSLATVNTQVSTMSAQLVELQAAVNKISERIESPQPAAPGRSYADALRGSDPSLRTTAQGPQSSERFPRHLELVLHQVVPMKPVLADISPAALLERARQAIRASLSSEALPLPKLRAVARHPSKDVILTAATPEDIGRLRSDTSWVSHLDPGLIYRPPTFPIAVHHVPTNFDPTQDKDIASLKDDNPRLHSALARVSWANPRAVEANQKRASTLILYLTDPDTANHYIDNSVAIEGALRPTEMSHRAPPQCHNCQAFGHTASRCAKEPTCALCSETHRTADCTSVCPEPSPCSDRQNCIHGLKCANCGENHRATSPSCQERKDIMELAKQQRINSAPLKYPTHQHV
jgi:hypothetical protein